MKKIVKLELCIVFYLLILFPLVQMIFSIIPEGETQENRIKKTRPDFNILKLHKFFKNYEEYFNDSFGFRAYFIQANTYISYKVFHISSDKRVVLGKDNWLFYDDPKDGVSLKDFYGDALFSEQEIKELRDNVTKLDAQFQKIKIPYLFVIAPNKHTIYPEQLPDYILRKKGKKTRADQIAEVFLSCNISHIDLREPLLEAKKDLPYPLYYKIDTHWNSLGAFIGYSKIIPKIVNLLPEKSIHVLSLNHYKLEQKKNPILWDIAQFILLKEDLEDWEMCLMPKEKIPYSYKEISPGIELIITEKHSPKAPKVLIFRDSFYNALIPFLSPCFAQSLIINDRKIDFSTIEKVNPDFVLIQFVERYSEYVVFKGIQKGLMDKK